MDWELILRQTLSYIKQFRTGLLLRFFHSQHYLLQVLQALSQEKFDLISGTCFKTICLVLSMFFILFYNSK